MLFCQSCHTTEKRPYHAHDSISQLKPSSEPCKATDSTHETANKSYHLPTMAGLSRTPVGKYGASSKKTNKTNKNKHKRNKHTQQERKILFELDTTQTWLLAVHLSNFQSNRGLFCLLSYPPEAWQPLHDLSHPTLLSMLGETLTPPFQIHLPCSGEQARMNLLKG